MTLQPDEGVTSIVLTSDNHSLGVCQWGDPDGAPVFWLHGTPGSRLLRHPVAEYRAHRLRVITYDRPGYGLSTRREGRRAADAAADVRVIADAIYLDRFGVAGVSGGATSALACAALLPDRVVRCATVVGHAPFGAEGLDFYSGMDEEARAGWEASLRGGVALEAEWRETLDWARSGLPREDLPADTLSILAETFKEAARQGPGGFVDDCLAEVRDRGFRVEDVRAPARLMFARNDTSVPAAHAEWLLKHLPRAEIIWVDGGHFGPRLEEEMRLLAWLGHGSGARGR